MRQRRNLRGLISVTLFLEFVINRSNSKSWDVRTFVSIVCNVINSTRGCLKAIAQNHATYPGTLSALRAPNLKWWSANRGQNKEKTAKTVQSGSRFTLFRLNCIKIVSVGTGFWRRDVSKKYKTTGDFVDLVEVLASAEYSNGDCWIISWQHWIIVCGPLRKPTPDYFRGFNWSKNNFGEIHRPIMAGLGVSVCVSLFSLDSWYSGIRNVNDGMNKSYLYFTN